MDTTTLIPQNIQISTSTVDNHLRKVPSDLIYILNKKKPPIPGLTYSEPTKIALQQIATLLNRNEIPEAVEKDSTQVSLRTSEGEDTQQPTIPNDNIIVKHNIQTSPLQTQPSTPNKQHNFHYNTKTTADTQFNTLLKEHLFEVQKLKKSSYKQPKTIVQTYLPNTPPFIIPTPKNTNRKIRKPTFQPTLGRPRLSPYAYSNITKNTAVRELLAQHAADNFLQLIICIPILVKKSL